MNTDFDSVIHDRLKIGPVEEALYMAITAHTGQHYDDKPYHHHILYVEKVLKSFGFYEKEILISGMLHDAVEDGDLTLKNIENKFGREIAEIVYCVTDELGFDRDEIKSKTYPKIASNKKAIIVKLADRIANVEYGMLTNSSKPAMYKEEFPEFKKHLYDPKHGFRIQNMWRHLEGILDLV
jgi:(p)ppGpp synthase/HD superfamily hydrolase